MTTLGLLFLVFCNVGVAIVGAVIVFSRRGGNEPVKRRPIVRPTPLAGSTSVPLVMMVIGAIVLAGLLLIALPVLYFSMQPSSVSPPAPVAYPAPVGYPTEFSAVPVEAPVGQADAAAPVQLPPYQRMEASVSGDAEAAVPVPFTGVQRQPMAWPWGALILFSLIPLCIAAVRYFGLKQVTIAGLFLLAPLLVLTMFWGVARKQSHVASEVAAQHQRIAADLQAAERERMDALLQSETAAAAPPAPTAPARPETVLPEAAALPPPDSPVVIDLPSLWTGATETGATHTGDHAAAEAAAPQAVTVATSLRGVIAIMLVLALIGTAVLIRFLRPHAMVIGAIVAVVMVAVTLLTQKVRESSMSQMMAVDRESGTAVDRGITKTASAIDSPLPPLVPAIEPTVEPVNAAATASPTVSDTEPPLPSKTEEPNEVGDHRLIEYLGASGSGRRLTEWPAWVNAKDETNAITGDETFVMQSGWFATPVEAEAELVERVRPRIQSFLTRTSEPVDFSKLKVDFDLVRQNHLVSRRLLEESALETVSHREPIFQVTWEFQLRDSVRRTIVASAVPQLKQDRLLQVGIGFGLLTLLFGTWAAYFRLNDATHGQYKNRLRIAATAVTVVSSAVLFMA